MKTFSKSLYAILLLLAILAFAGCNGGSHTAPDPTTEPEPRMLTFTYDLMGGTYNGEGTCQVEVRENETAPSITPTKEGCQFVGWTKHIAADDAMAYSFDEPVVEDTVIYAIWKGLELSLHTGGGSFPAAASGGSADYSYYSNHVDFVLPIPEKEGYVFAGWYDSDAFTGQQIPYIPQGSTEPYTLYAKWVQAGTSLPIVYDDHCVRNADGTTSPMPDKQSVYREFFTDFYYFIVEEKGAEDSMKANAAKHLLKVDSLGDFLSIGSDYDAGRGNMVSLGYIAAHWFMETEPGGTLEGQNPWYFVGYCYKNGKHIDLLNHLAKFFSYWRYDEGFTTPTNNGSDFFADPWASVVDICKFFYFDENTSYVKTNRVINCFKNIPGVFYPEKLELITEFTVGETTCLTRPAFDGYTFVGWYRALDGEPVEAISPDETEQVQLIGVWEKAE